MAGYGVAVEKGYKSNALAPLIWLDIFVIPILLTGVFFIKIVALKYALVSIIFMLLLFTLIMYVLLFKKDPKLLQSEKYRLEDKRLDLIAQKDGPEPLNPNILTIGTTEIKGE
jgi:energy-coupling factor transporter transmembrane protein EcfT